MHPNREATLREVAQLIAAGWPQPITAEQITVYAEMLADAPPDELMAAVRRLIATSEYRPAVSVIRTAVIDARAVVPDETQAAAQRDALDVWEASRAVPWGAQAEPPERPEVHPAVLDAWTAVGADAYPAVFLRAFRDTRQRYIDDLLAKPLDSWAAKPELNP